jgi:hypothetical protein
VERLDEEEAPRREVLGDAYRRQFLVAEQVGLVLTNALGTQLVRWTMEVASEVGDRTQVRVHAKIKLLHILVLDG